MPAGRSSGEPMSTLSWLHVERSGAVAKPRNATPTIEAAAPTLASRRAPHEARRAAGSWMTTRRRSSGVDRTIAVKSPIRSSNDLQWAHRARCDSDAGPLDLRQGAVERHRNGVPRALALDRPDVAHHKPQTTRHRES